MPDNTKAAVLVLSADFFHKYIETCKQIEADYDKRCCSAISVFRKSATNEFLSRWEDLLADIEGCRAMLSALPPTKDLSVHNLHTHARAAYFVFSVYISSRIDVLKYLAAKEQGAHVSSSAYLDFIKTADENRKSLVSVMGSYEQEYKKLFAQQNLSKPSREPRRRKKHTHRNFRGSLLHYVLSGTLAGLTEQYFHLSRIVTEYAILNGIVGWHQYQMTIMVASFVTYIAVFTAYHALLGWLFGRHDG